MSNVVNVVVTDASNMNCVLDVPSQCGQCATYIIGWVVYTISPKHTATLSDTVILRHIQCWSTAVVSESPQCCGEIATQDAPCGCCRSDIGIVEAETDISQDCEEVPGSVWQSWCRPRWQDIWFRYFHVNQTQVRTSHWRHTFAVVTEVLQNFGSLIGREEYKAMTSRLNIKRPRKPWWYKTLLRSAIWQYSVFGMR